jgi:hypothetical protein
MVDQNHLLVLTKLQSEDMLVLRALKFNGSKPAKPKCTIKIKCPKIVSHIQATD